MKNKREIIGLLLFFAIWVALSSTAQSGGHDLKSYYPNPSVAFEDQFLDGYNYEQSPPGRSVLWFEDLGRGKWRQYNSLPGETCHYDQFKWRKVLRYQTTSHSCDGQLEVTNYSPGIVLIPKKWNGNYWTRSGTSNATHSIDGNIVCTGTNEWTAEVLGWVQITPTEQAIHFRTIQHSEWDTGSCATTDWQEDYYLVDNLRGSGEQGLRRSVGGNASGSFRWDVWFDSWSNY